MRIKIIAINNVCYYPELVGTEFELEESAPHTSDSWAFVRANTNERNVWFMIHKHLTEIISE